MRTSGPGTEGWQGLRLSTVPGSPEARRGEVDIFSLFVAQLRTLLPSERYRPASFQIMSGKEFHCTQSALLVLNATDQSPQVLSLIKLGCEIQ